MRAFLLAAMVLRRWKGAMLRTIGIESTLELFEIKQRAAQVASIQLLLWLCKSGRGMLPLYVVSSADDPRPASSCGEAPVAQAELRGVNNSAQLQNPPWVLLYFTFCHLMSSRCSLVTVLHPVHAQFLWPHVCCAPGIGEALYHCPEQ